MTISKTNVIPEQKYEWFLKTAWYRISIAKAWYQEKRSQAAGQKIILWTEQKTALQMIERNIVPNMSFSDWLFQK